MNTFFFPGQPYLVVPSDEDVWKQLPDEDGEGGEKWSAWATDLDMQRMVLEAQLQDATERCNRMASGWGHLKLMADGGVVGIEDVASFAKCHLAEVGCDHQFGPLPGWDDEEEPWEQCALCEANRPVRNTQGPGQRLLQIVRQVAAMPCMCHPNDRVPKTCLGCVARDALGEWT